ncbi:hypothetical protein BLS_007501 [Venturia inaequalis]|uniref:rRNA biogenesis protein RRP36 n=1 Tax=Venturia inaequalis TaxID=5025 RepID=A0A8H3U8W4_VENIN|nr:hypothetical protein BLS_007501 [Venturia inaequalis]
MARTNTSKTTSEKGRSDRLAKRVKRVEPESEDEEEQEEQEDDGYSSPSVLETGDADAADIGSDLDGEDEEDDDDESSSDDEATDATALQSWMSFGTLVKVQDSLGDNGEGGKRKRKRGVGDEEVDGKLQALRERLRELKGKKTRTEESTTAKSTTAKGMKPAERPEFSADSSDEASNEDEEEEEEGENAPAKKKGRSSKHAPTEISSKRAVTRRRDAVVLKKDTTRDPRFDPLSGEVDHHILSKKYAFLNDYRTAELATLKKSIKNKKLPEEEREALKRQVVSMESKMAFEKGKEREARVVREHRREERKRVLEGKGAWHVKRAVVREEALKERFEGMKGRRRDKVIERRRKKVTAKERKGMPEERRA